jgi:hypothetical protein
MRATFYDNNIKIIRLKSNENKNDVKWGFVINYTLGNFMLLVGI